MLPCHKMTFTLLSFFEGVSQQSNSWFIPFKHYMMVRKFLDILVTSEIERFQRHCKKMMIPMMVMKRWNG